MAIGFNQSTLTGTGTLTVQPNPGDNVGQVQVSGTFTGCTLTVGVVLSGDTTNTVIPVAVVDMATGTVTSTNTGISLVNSQAHGWQLNVSSVAVAQISAALTSYGSGSLVLTLRTFQGNAPFADVVGSGGGAIPGSFSTLAITGLFSDSAHNGLTALSGGGQPGATALSSDINRITTVAAPGDSCILPVSSAGLKILAINSGANSANIFPQSGDQINAYGANIQYALGVGDIAVFTCAVAGTWNTSNSANLPAFAVTSSAATTTATFAANLLTGAELVVCNVPSLAGSATLTTRTPTQMFGDFLNSFVGMTWTARIANTGASHTMTIGAGSGWTLSGGSTYAVGTGSYIDFKFQFTSPTAGTMTAIASGTNCP